MVGWDRVGLPDSIANCVFVREDALNTALALL
jgi:hypothetical protein